MALVILDHEVEPFDKRRVRCVVCGKQEATLKALFKSKPETGSFCAYCVLYSGMTQWGYDNRDEILHVGRAAQELATKHNKTIPALDRRGRLQPEDASRFMLGVIFTTKMLERFPRMPPTEEPS